MIGVDDIHGVRSGKYRGGQGAMIRVSWWIRFNRREETVYRLVSVLIPPGIGRVFRGFPGSTVRRPDLPANHHLRIT